MERMNNKMEIDTVSLFAGIGGFDLGFTNAGFKIIWANDFDKYAIETYKVNIGDHIKLGDIREIVNEVPMHKVLIAGFPCQPFSSLGKQQGFKDERGTLFFTVKEIVKKCGTEVVVLENVKNIVNHDKGETLKRIIRELEEINFTCYYKVLNSADFGVPQRRNRMFLVAFRNDCYNKKIFEFPEGDKLDIKTQDLLDESVGREYFLSPKICQTILHYDKLKYSGVPTIDLEISKTLTATMHKMHRACQDNYLTDDLNWMAIDQTNKTNIRKLTPNECRKLQGFPSDWKQVVSDCQAYKQFGNAVTVNVTYAVALKIKNHIRDNAL